MPVAPMSGAASPAAELAALRAAITGPVVTPGTPGYERLRRPAIRRTDDVRPRAIVMCAQADDVAMALTLARRLGLAVAPRSGGHCFAGRSTTAGLVLDVSAMAGVTVEGDVAVVGAGVRLGPLYDALHAAGRAVPAGCGATVGIAGLTLGGGIGVLGRRHGLTCDRLLRAEVVLADGRVVRCDAEQHADLFWALRGAGGGQFGVVTSLWLRTVPAPETTAFELTWPGAHAAAAVVAWQSWSPAAPDAVDATLRVVAPADPGRPPRVHLVGAVHDRPAAACALLDRFVARVGVDPAGTRVHHRPYRDAKRWLASLEDDPGPPGAVPVATSEIFRRELPPAVVASLLGHLGARRGHAWPRQLTFTPLGGAYNRVPVGATAFAHRRDRFLLEHAASAPSPTVAAARDWARRSRRIASVAGTGRVYPNFPDPELPDPARAYHGENLGRLRRIKRRYDPDGVFRFHQSL